MYLTKLDAVERPAMDTAKPYLIVTCGQDLIDHLARQADQLHDMLADDENLEPWVQAKITKAADYIKNAFESLTYEKDNPKGR